MAQAIGLVTYADAFRGAPPARVETGPAGDPLPGMLVRGPRDLPVRW